MSLKESLEDLNNQKSPDQKPWAEIGLDGGEIYTGVLDSPIADDWTPILRSFGLDPDVFMVVDDKVKMSKWQQSKRTESGDRDVIWLYAYKAVFKRKAGLVLADSEFEKYRKEVKNFKPRKPIKTSDEQPTTFVVNWADWQLGKSAG
jgi:hypothetical protein